MAAVIEEQNTQRQDGHWGHKCTRAEKSHGPGAGRTVSEDQHVSFYV